MRVKPLCRYYEKCGGCCYQHLDYEYQLSIKKKQVEESFWKIGKIGISACFGANSSRQGFIIIGGRPSIMPKLCPRDWKIGFLDISGGKLVDIERCEIMEETINEKMRILRENKQLRSNKDAQLTIWSDSFVDEPSEKESIIRVVKEKNFLVPRDGFFQANLYLTDQIGR